MADLSTHVDPIVAAIYRQYERRNADELQRTYLGASVIGRECARALWYSFRWASPAEHFEGRMLRLFQTGHLAEPRFVEDLRAIGVTVHDVDPASGKQFGFSDLGGHMRGHMDGCAHKVPQGGQQWHVLEFKTHSSKSFAKLQKDGVRKAKPEHFDQMTWYMGKSGMARALYLAVNKDNDELYSERIEFDPARFAQITAKAEQIIFGAGLPPRVSDDPKFYLCGWCQHQAVCHGGKVAELSCRTCVHATPERDGDGRWSCDRAGSDSVIPMPVQRAGCETHLPLPYLVPFADPIDAGDGWIEFKRKDNGREFVVAADGATHPYPHFPIYTSKELSAAQDTRIFGTDEVEMLKAHFPGAKVVA